MHSYSHNWLRPGSALRVASISTSKLWYVSSAVSPQSDVAHGPLRWAGRRADCLAMAGQAIENVRPSFVLGNCLTP